MLVPQTTPDWSNKTILIVEDEEIIRFFFETALRSTKAKLLFAINGSEGIKIALSNDDIDCILMDIRMPVTDGYEAMRAIKAVKKNLPIVVQTAYALAHDRKKAIESGCNEYLTKPMRIDVLLTILGKYLGS